MHLNVLGQSNQVSVYEYGQSLDSCESNFINLFRNWPKSATNHQQIALVSYKYVETLKDSSTKAHYIPLLVDPESLVCMGSSTRVRQETSYASPNQKKDINIKNTYVNILPGKDAPMLRQNINVFGATGEVAHMKVYYRTIEEIFTTIVVPGDKVYAITIQSGGKEYTNYVFCRPGMNKVVFDKLFYGVKAQQTPNVEQ
ncbi:hypothetical protein EGT74_20275 [Chitinophaga lutea]|uniref:Uncharacterized protein n=1 Tax=Chitinophaga lutea TaxID=2488634 RepID=A0A3N4PZ41_9BACT|nr:hypothetical protein [Chitinophaga lutea]RPE09337.1 hypothetical protein EGT74_20275 [Chitinophaga lutea]